MTSDRQTNERLRLRLINPVNPLVSITNVGDNYWNQFRIWKPLGLLVIAGQTPDEWDIEVLDENLGVPDYASMPKPDLVGISAFTSQINRAYEIAAFHRERGTPVVMGGIHATMRTEEVSSRVDAVVTGEAENVWPLVLEDAKRGQLQPIYAGSFADMADIPPARHDLLASGYRFGSIQVTRGCPLNCSFCSVTEFNGREHRYRKIANVIEEFKQIREKLILVVDDNLIGTKAVHIERAKNLFRAMIDAKLGKKWMGQVTINMADDDELMELAAESGCFGVLIGFESPTEEGLAEINKKFNTRNGRNMRDSVRRIQNKGMTVAGSFALGLDIDDKGIGRRLAEAANEYGVDIMNVLFLTPLPGTRLFDKMEKEGRIVADNFPEDWRYYNFNFPVAAYNHLAWDEMIKEMGDSTRHFYTYPRILKRMTTALWRTKRPISVLVGLATGLSYKWNSSLDAAAYEKLDLSRGAAFRD